MPHIVIISSSVRIVRNSHHVALYFQKYITENNLATVEIADLQRYNFPLFNERLRFQPEPTAGTLEFAEKIRTADGIVIVTPEYNSGYPASLKNVVDLLYDEWHRKPVAIATVSNGPFGGMQVLTSIQFTMWKIRAWTVPAMFPCPKAHEAFDENGNATDKAATDKRASVFIGELLWCIEAKRLMDNKK